MPMGIKKAKRAIEKWLKNTMDKGPWSCLNFDNDRKKGWKTGKDKSTSKVKINATRTK